jgi:copper chaperone CopZ
MTCGGCTLATRKVLTRLPGVVRADVTYDPQQAVVTYDPAKVTVAQMIAAVKTLNYTATVVADPKAASVKGAATGAATKA